MLFVTGDTHGDHDFAKLTAFAGRETGLTKRDFVIVAGDFGGVFFADTLEKDLDAYSALPFTVLFVDGNHENFDLLEAYPVRQWKGGKVHMVRKDIIHLMRGQIYTIGGRRIFTFGGATSVDRVVRTEGFSWWRRELPTWEEADEAIANLKACGNTVDYIVTHSCCERALMYPPLRTRRFQADIYPENRMLSYFQDIVQYRHWYFGHYHMDAVLNDKMTVLFQEIVRLETNDDM